MVGCFGNGFCEVTEGVYYLAGAVLWLLLAAVAVGILAFMWGFYAPFFQRRR